MFDNLRKNLKPLVGSILVALTLWFMVATDKDYSHQIRVPINIIRLAAGKTLAKSIPEYAVLELQGKGRSHIAMWFYDISFNLELPEIKTSQTIHLIDYINFLDLPSTFGVTVRDIIEPANIDLVVDEKIKLRKPIFLSGSVGTQDGYLLLDYHFQYDSVDVTGPKSEVEKITHIYTDRLEIRERKMKFIQRIDLVNPVPEIISIDPQIVNVEFNIQRLVEEWIYDIPISILNVPSGLKVEAFPPTLALHIKGGERVVAEVDSSIIKAEIDFSKNYRRDRLQYAVHISTPQNIGWIESIPKTFELKVKRR